MAKERTTRDVQTLDEIGELSRKASVLALAVEGIAFNEDGIAEGAVEAVASLAWDLQRALAAQAQS